MTLNDVKTILEAEVLTGDDKLGREVDSACGSDLMSDVLAFSRDKVLLLTGLVNAQVIRTAEMMDIKAVAFIRGKVPSEEVIELAKQKNITVMTTKKMMFIACGLLYSSGLGGAEN